VVSSRPTAPAQKRCTGWGQRGGGVPDGGPARPVGGPDHEEPLVDVEEGDAAELLAEEDEGGVQELEIRVGGGRSACGFFLWFFFEM